MFFITVISYAITNNTVDTVRCVGYQPEEWMAQMAVMQNLGDIHEGRFNFAVIEQIENGVFPDSKDLVWYEYNDGWKMITKPEWAEGVSNWCIG